MFLRKLPQILASILLFVLLFSSCVEDEPYIIKTNKERFSAEEEVKIGNTLNRQIEADPHNFPKYNNTDTDYVNRLNDYLDQLLHTAAITTQVINRNDFVWDAVLIEDEKINLFASPGGYVYINTGLLKALDNEAQLLAMIAHELRYLDEGMTVLKLKDEYGGTTMGDLVLGNEVTQIGNMTLSLRDLAYPSTEVIQSDSFAVEIICPFKYEILGMQSALQKLITLSESESVKWLEQRPGGKLRLDKLEAMDMDCGLNESTYQERYESMTAPL